MITITAPYLPIALVAFSWVLNGTWKAAAGDLVGCAVGHVGWFVRDVWTREMVGGKSVLSEAPHRLYVLLLNLHLSISLISIVPTGNAYLETNNLELHCVNLLFCILQHCLSYCKLDCNPFTYHRALEFMDIFLFYADAMVVHHQPTNDRCGIDYMNKKYDKLSKFSVISPFL